MMGGALIVDRVGFTTVQDAGRPGWAHLGVPHSGAADRTSFALANRLVGNPNGSAMFETSGGLRLHVLQPVTLVLTGADCEAFIDEQPLVACRVRHVQSGSIIHIRRLRGGLRSYLAFAGGITGRALLGSLSHDSLSHLVPIDLHEGCELAIGDSPAQLHDVSTITTLSLDVPLIATSLTTAQLMPGPHIDWCDTRVLTDRGLSWRVSAQSDRVGVRLSGNTLPRRREDEIPSLPLVRGAIQMPSPNELIVMLADHPTTGGYPVVGVMGGDDVDRLAQTPPGATVTLRLRRG